MMNNFKETLADIYTGKDDSFLASAESVLNTAVDGGAFNCRTLLENVKAQAKAETDPAGAAHALVKTLDGCKHLYPAQKESLFAGTHRPAHLVTAADIAHANQERAKEKLWKQLDRAMNPPVLA